MASNKHTLSFSSLKQFDKSPSHFLQYKRREFKSTAAMRLGTLTHLSILEPDEYKKNVVVTDLSRRTKAFKEFEAENESKEIITTKEAEQIQGMTDSVAGMVKARKLIHNADEKEKSHTWKYRDHVFRGIPDAVSGNCIIDLKTTSDIDKFQWSASKYNYDSQAYIYSKLFGYEFLFIVIDKNTHQIGMFDCSPQFYERGEDKVRKASEAYDLFYKTKDFDPKQYFISKTL